MFGSSSRPQSNRLIYAVGDVHGRADLVEQLVEKILVDALTESDRTGETRPPVVFLGDMIDRGPNTREVLDFLSGMRDWPELELVLLGGNHEAMLFDFLSDPMKNTNWLKYGGYETVLSYGLRPLGDLSDHKAMTALASDLDSAMGEHLDFLQGCQPFFQDGNLAFVHAGAEPDLPMASQPLRTLLWGSDTFATKRRQDGLWIVHGHVIVETPKVRRGRIAIDTGAYATGRLTAMRIKGTDLRFLSEIGTR